MGRDWLHLFDYSILEYVTNIGATNEDLQALIFKYSIFKEDIIYHTAAKFWEVIAEG